jgi:hypothetical protein
MTAVSVRTTVSPEATLKCSGSKSALACTTSKALWCLVLAAGRTIWQGADQRRARDGRKFAGHVPVRDQTMEELKVGRVVAEPGKAGPIYGATVRWQDGKIVEVQASGRAEDAGADRGLLAMPALTDAHDHARGLHHLARRKGPILRAVAGGALPPPPRRSRP